MKTSRGNGNGNHNIPSSSSARTHGVASWMTKQKLEHSRIKIVLLANLGFAREQWVN